MLEPLYHSDVSVLSGGFVDVISGLLVTTHLLQSLQRAGRIRFDDFYAERARRILSATLVVAALSVLNAAPWVPPLLIGEVQPAVLHHRRVPGAPLVRASP